MPYACLMQTCTQRACTNGRRVLIETDNTSSGGTEILFRRAAFLKQICGPRTPRAEGKEVGGEKGAAARVCSHAGGRRLGLMTLRAGSRGRIPAEH
jgi:hypothetical protein